MIYPGIHIHIMNMDFFKRSTRVLLLLLCGYGTICGSEGMHRNLILHYDRPAQHFEEALVIGNGTLGAIVYGGVNRDVISLNNLTLWTGEPDFGVTTPEAHKVIPVIRNLLNKEDYRGADREQYKVQGHYSQNYQPLGKLTITYRQAEIEDYRRSLDISNAIARTVCRKNGAPFSAEYFASAPDSAIVIRLKSNSKEGIHALLTYETPLPHFKMKNRNDEVMVEGYVAYHSYPVYLAGIARDEKHLYDPERGIRFRSLIRVVASDGKVKSYDTGELKLEGVHEAMILIVNVTSFNGFDKNPVTEGRDYRRLSEMRMSHAVGKSFDALRKNHVDDYRYYFDRVELDLGRTATEIAVLPTDLQLRLYTDEKQQNPELETLYFQYGRYLMIACSRTPGVPANLQGLWNEQVLPPWSCNYTTNINLEENYWAAETANLSEMHLPLMDFIRNLSRTGAATAQAYYGVDKGWCLGHNTDIWAMTCPVGLSVGHPSWACWNMGGAWLSTHIWEHYLFTQDVDFLRRYYPVLKGAAEFCMNWLVEKDGMLLTSPGTSPENLFITPEGYAAATSYGCTADLAMTRECLIDAMKAAEILKADKNFRREVKLVLSHLLPYRVGKEGDLQEWFHDWPDQDPRHRHQSHLFGLYPGHHLSLEGTPVLAKACARTLEIKGDETTGWSAGWRVNLYARLHDGEGAYRMYRRLLRNVSPDHYVGENARRGGGTYPNLLDAHAPFQIDGNFGGCAGMIEMLLQSDECSITLLPAIPVQWKDGKVKGLCARGGFVVDMEWKDGKVCMLNLTSRGGGKTKLRYNGKSQVLRLRAGEIKRLL